MRALVVGSGAGGATVARELQSHGFEVIILEAGSLFKPFTRHLSWADPLRNLRIINENSFKHLFPPMKIQHSSEELILVRGITTGGSTVLSCGNLVRTERGLNEIGLDLSPEYDRLEAEIKPMTISPDVWRPITKSMFYAAEKLGLNPQSTPKAVDIKLCNSCGLCELGCKRGARWDSRMFLNDAIKKGAILKIKSPVEKLIIQNGVVKGVKGKFGIIEGDIIVLAAGGIGSAQILNNSGVKTVDHLWADIVLTLGGVVPGARQLEEPPMLWYTKDTDFILSPYPDILSHYFHPPWRKVSINDRVGLMVKLADTEMGSVLVNGKIDKKITEYDRERLDFAIDQASQVMRESGVKSPLTEGVLNGGHLGGTIPLSKDDVELMRPSWLPKGLWVADLSLVPKSQGMPTILLASAIGLRVSQKIIENNSKN